MTLEERKHKAGRTKEARARKQLTNDEFFFYQHAGYSYDPKTQTPEQGRIACAKRMAEAEAFARGQEYEYEWADDWDIGSHRDYYGEDSVYADREPDTCESCVLKDRDGDVLASCGCIDDADDNYRRVIEAELASEALAAYEREIEILDVH